MAPIDHDLERVATASPDRTSRPFVSSNTKNTQALPSAAHREGRSGLKEKRAAKAGGERRNADQRLQLRIPCPCVHLCDRTLRGVSFEVDPQVNHPAYTAG